MSDQRMQQIEILKTEFNEWVQQIANTAEDVAEYPTIDDKAVDQSHLSVQVWVTLYERSEEEAMMDL